MNTREIAAEYRLSHWAGKMRERQESGLSIRSFCEQEGLHENVYYYWQRKLREAAISHMEKKQASEKGTDLAVSGFTEVQVMDIKPIRPENLTPDKLHIEIAGIKITVDSSYPTEKLAVLLRELAGSCYYQFYMKDLPLPRIQQNFLCVPSLNRYLDGFNRTFFIIL